MPAQPGLEPLEQPSSLQAAEPRINGAIPTDRSRQRPFVASGAAAAPVVPPPGPGATATQTGDVTLNFVDTDIREIARTILGTTLNLNYTIDPNVHGTGSIETGTPMQRSALIPTLETLLNANGATLIERNGVYAVVPLPAGATRNLVSGANAIGAGTQVVPLRYASAKDLAKVLEPYVAEGGKIAADPAPNAIIVSGDAAVRQTLVGLIRAFDIDILAGQSYALFPVGDSDPAKRASEFERVLQAQAEGALGGIVRVVPMERVNAVLVVSSQPRYIDAARRFFRLTNQLEDATARAWHVYYVQNGQSADLENLLQRAFTPRNVSPTPGPPGSTAPGAEQLTIGGGRGPGGGTTGFGGQGSTAGLGGAGGGAGVTTGLPGAAGGAGAGGGLGAGIPQPTAAAEAAPPATEPLSTETGAGGAAPENRMRIIANRRNNALLIYATPSEYAVIEGMLRKIDIIPLQVLIEATIAEVDLNDSLQYGTQFFFKADHIAFTLGPLSGLPCSRQPDLSLDCPLFHTEQISEFRALGARRGDQGQGALGASGHGPRQRAGTSSGRPAGAGADRNRDEHARGRGAGRQQRRLSFDGRHHAGDAARQLRRARFPRYRPGSQRCRGRGDEHGRKARRPSTIRYSARGWLCRMARRSGWPV